MNRFARHHVHQAYSWLTHVAGRITGRYYFEDYKRVYPGRLAYNRLGRRREARPNDVRNYLNHRKFYEFVAQFVRNKVVADVGCGSGYGCEILKQRGAREVHGCDVSGSAVGFARRHFGASAVFTRQGITGLHGYADSSFDVVVSSEVLEHVKEYGMERKALQELKRITRPAGLLVIATPNSELLGVHGFSFDEIGSLLASEFDHYCLFENALLPFGLAKSAWLRRLAEGQTGVIVSQRIDLAESVLPDGEVPELKSGLEPGRWPFQTLTARTERQRVSLDPVEGSSPGADVGDVAIDTTLLHNTHSWIAVVRR